MSLNFLANDNGRPEIHGLHQNGEHRSIGTNNTKSNLKRNLSLFTVTNIVIANIIGAGIFTTSGLLMQDLKQPIIMLLLWIFGGLLALCGALSYGRLGAAMPEAGGEYIFLAKLYHPLAGFLSGWVSFIVGFSAPIAASSIGFSEYLYRTELFGSASPFLIKKTMAIAIIISFTLIHLKGLELGARVQNYLTILKIALLVALMFFGFTCGKGELNYLLQGDAFHFDFNGWKQLGLSLMWIMFAYSGWNAATYIGAEIKNPKKNLPRSLLLGTSLVMLIYLSLNILYLYAIPPDKIQGVISIGGLAAAYLFNPSFEKILSVMIAFALLSSISAFIILGPRVYFAMAKNAHFFKFASEVHPTTHVPAKSIYIQGLIACIMVLSGSFDQILTYMGFSLGIFPIIAIFGVYKLKNPGSYFIPGIYISISSLILLLAYLERPVESTIAIITVLIGIPAYRFIAKN
jgi:APA family basic amino acid/polyamine antiporter